jgi:DNA-binding CsgD family transcriptional regulator
MNLLKELALFSDPEQICQMDTDGLIDFPLYLFWKDVGGKYLGANNKLASIVGFSAGNNLSGYTDNDLCWSESASIYRANDKHVMHLNAPRVAIEPGKIFDGTDTKAVSYKLPLRSRNQKVIGVIGLSMPIDSFQLKADTQSSSLNNMDLPARQRQCMYYLSKGMTIKEIACAMNLSPRTVGHYLERIKKKFNCHNRSQLIAKVFNKVENLY